MSLSGAGMQPGQPRSLAQPRLGTSCPPPGPVLPPLGASGCEGAQPGDSSDGDGVRPSVRLHWAAAGAAASKELLVWLQAQPWGAGLLAAAPGWIRPLCQGLLCVSRLNASGQGAGALPGPHACMGTGGSPCTRGTGGSPCTRGTVLLLALVPPSRHPDGVGAPDRRKRKGKQPRCRGKSLIINQQQQPRAPGQRGGPG